MKYKKRKGNRRKREKASKDSIAAAHAETSKHNNRREGKRNATANTLSRTASWDAPTDTARASKVTPLSFHFLIMPKSYPTTPKKRLVGSYDIKKRPDTPYNIQKRPIKHYKNL